MDTIVGLSVRRYASSDPSVFLTPNQPWTSSGAALPTLVITFSESTRVNQLEITTESGNPAAVVVGVSRVPKATAAEAYLFQHQKVVVEVGTRLNLSPPSEITNVYAIFITFHSTDTQTVKVYGCIEEGQLLCEILPLSAP